MSGDWSHPLRLHELARGPVELRLEPDAQARAKIAKDLGLQSLPALSANLRVRPWLDGAEVTGHFKAVVEQLCSLSLEAFEQPIKGAISLSVVPAGSPNAPGGSEAHELELDLDAPEPPDVLAGDSIDLAAIVVEHLALEIDPFPRKPGAAFDYSPPAETESPFAVLRGLKDPKA
jgi:uncharacterized metal-binding protein YceD (DUF177 family)